MKSLLKPFCCNKLTESFSLQFGTVVLDSQLAKIYNKKVDGLEIEKGVSFPVCISVNEVICNHSPLPSEELVSSFESEKIST